VGAVEELSDPHPLLCFPFQNVVQRLGQQGVQRVADQLLDRALAESLRLPSLMVPRRPIPVVDLPDRCEATLADLVSVIATRLQLARSNRRPAARSRTLRVFASIWWPLEIPVTQVEDHTVIAGQDGGDLSVKKTAGLAVGRGDRDQVLAGRRPEDPAERT